MMRKFFTGLTVLLLFAFAAAHASRMLFPWRLVIEGNVIPPMMSLIIAGIIAVLALAVLLEMRSRAVEPVPLTRSHAPQSAATRGLESRAPETRAPFAFTVKQGRRYRADIRLSWWEQSIATNEYIAGQLASVGFTDVSVQGDGAQRLAEGLWPHPDKTAEMPAQIVGATEIAEPANNTASGTMSASADGTAPAPPQS